LTNDQLFRIHIKFSKLHIPFVVILALYIIERNIKNSSLDSMFTLLFILPILIVEVIAYKKSFFNNYKILVVLRYFELCVVSACFLYANYFHYTSILAYILLYIEYITFFDYSDYYYRALSILFSLIPIVLSGAFNIFFSYETDMTLFIRLVILSLTVIIITYITNIFRKIISEFEQKLYSQNRLLLNLNEANDALQIHQEKVKHANEELGYQKVMLEAAYKKINNANTEIMIQSQIVKYISSSLDIGKLMTLITDSLFNEMSLCVCAISLNSYVVDNTKMKYKICASFGDEYVKELSTRIEEGCFQLYLDNNKSFVDNHVEKNKYSFVKSIETGSILIVPLVQDEIQIGFIFAQDFKYDAFVDNVAFYEGIIAQFLIALNNANLYSKMENMAIHDALTGIYNRGHLSKLLHQYLNEAIINKTSLTVALFDIDKFKNVNDTYGHLFGDIIIKIIAVLADEKAKANNGIVGRYGGEEFVVVFPNKELKEAYELIEQLHREIKEKDVFHNGQVIHINVSFGISSYPETCKNPKDLLNRADGAMYYSKENGRDRITIDSDEVRKKIMI